MPRYIQCLPGLSSAFNSAVCDRISIVCVLGFNLCPDSAIEAGDTSISDILSV